MSAPTQQDFINIIAGKISGFEEFAKNFGQQRFLVYKSAIHAPDEGADAIAKEDAEMEKIASAFRCEVQQEGGKFTLFFYFDESGSPFIPVVDAGMPAPLAGGNHGISTNPDGSTYASPTPVNRWYEPVPGYAKPATGVFNEIKIMLADLFRNEMEEVIAESKQEMLALVKAYVAGRIGAVAGG